MCVCVCAHIPGIEGRSRAEHTLHITLTQCKATHQRHHPHTATVPECYHANLTCALRRYLGESSKGDEGEGVEGDVGIRADAIGRGVLPGLEPCPMQQVVELQRQDTHTRTHTQLSVCAGCTEGRPVCHSRSVIGTCAL